MRTRAAFVLAALLLGCRGEGAARDALARSDRATLAADAVAVHRRTVARGEREIPPGEWPPSFRAFEPKRVSVSNTGVFIITHERFVETAGIFIRVDRSYEPPRSGDPGFEHIAGDFYWFSAPG